MDAYFYQVDIEETVNDRIFSYHPLLNTHSNQEHDNENLRPPFPKSIEQFVEQVINPVPV